MRKLISSMMICVLILGLGIASPSVAKAAESSEGICVDGSYLTHDDESSVTVYPRLRGVYLLKGTGTITVTGNRLVGCYGTTTATKDVSKVSVGVTLQRYTGSSWTTIATWSKSDYNTNFVGSYKGYSVAGGYYYRVTTQHWAATDWSMGSTNGVWVAK